MYQFSLAASSPIIDHAGPACHTHVRSNILATTSGRGGCARRYRSRGMLWARGRAGTVKAKARASGSLPRYCTAFFLFFFFFFFLSFYLFSFFVLFLGTQTLLDP